LKKAVNRKRAVVCRNLSLGGLLYLCKSQT
jgi:hypothetical protein